MPLIDTDTAAYATGLNPRTIRRLVKAGTLTNRATVQGRGHPIRLDLDEVLAHTDPHRAALNPSTEALAQTDDVL